MVPVHRYYEIKSHRNTTLQYYITTNNTTTFTKCKQVGFVSSDGCSWPSI